MLTSALAHRCSDEHWLAIVENYCSCSVNVVALKYLAPIVAVVPQLLKRTLASVLRMKRALLCDTFEIAFNVAFVRLLECRFSVDGFSSMLMFDSVRSTIVCAENSAKFQGSTTTVHESAIYPRTLRLREVPDSIMESQECPSDQWIIVHTLFDLLDEINGRATFRRPLSKALPHVLN